MEKLNYLHFRSSVTEVADISGNISAAITRFSLDDDFLNNEGSKLSLLSVSMHNGIGAIRNKQLSEQLDDADNQRDNLTVVFNRFVKSYYQWNHPETRLAAERILSILKSHGGNHTKESYEKQSALLESLLTELGKPENQEALTILNLVLLYEELKQSQEKFKKLYRQSAELEAEKPQTESPTKLRKETRGLINELVDYLNVMMRKDTDKYRALHTEIAELINDLNAKIKGRI